MIIAITAVLCGADGWTEIEEFGKSNEGWFRKFRKLDNGLPSHESFGGVFSQLSAAAFQELVDQGGDYVLALKGNPGILSEQVEEAFIDVEARNYEGLDSDYYETVECGHGRCETRRYWTLGELEGIDRKDQWQKLNGVGMV